MRDSACFGAFFRLIERVTSPAERILARTAPLVIGHRGCCAAAPENTLPSFQMALDAGADLVELDYRHSKDGVPAVIHDRILNRTTDARQKWRRRRAKVADITAAELQTLDAGRWFDKEFSGAKIPLLAEALELICNRGGVALIERKSGDAETLVRLLRERDWINKVIVISFDWQFLLELHELEPRQILGALGPPARLSNGRRPAHIRRRIGSRLNDLEKTGAKIAVWNRRISRRAVRLAHQRGLKVWIYTVNEIGFARHLTGIGVDGIITDRAHQLV